MARLSGALDAVDTDGRFLRRRAGAKVKEAECLCLAVYPFHVAELHAHAVAVASGGRGADCDGARGTDQQGTTRLSLALLFLVGLLATLLLRSRRDVLFEPEHAGIAAADRELQLGGTPMPMVVGNDLWCSSWGLEWGLNRCEG